VVFIRLKKTVNICEGGRCASSLLIYAEYESFSPEKPEA
jgi:hypothetical protein